MSWDTAHIPGILPLLCEATTGTFICLPEGFPQSGDGVLFPDTAAWICWRINTALSPGEALNQSLMKGWVDKHLSSLTTWVR